MRQIATVACILTACCAWARPEMSPHTRTVLQTYLSAEQIAAVESTLSAVEQESLGPLEEHGVEIHLPERAVTADPALAESGTGQRGAPWVGAIEANLGGIDSSATLLLPDGYYRVGELEVPDGIVLKSETGGAVLVNEPGLGGGDEGRVPMLSLGSGSGVVGLEIDGTGGGAPIGVYVREGEGAIVSDCHIHDMRDGIGVYGPGTGATVVANLIETIGYSGIRNGSEWLIAHNTVRFAGIDRVGGGGGDDGIIPNTRTTSSLTLNNLIVSEKRPNGRHAMATQVSHDNLFAGNVCVCLGRLRGGIVLADASDRNVLTGNVVIGVPDAAAGQRANMGIHLNGNENVVRGNAVIGTNLGVSVNPGRTGNVIEDNYLQVTGNPVLLRGAEPGEDTGNVVGENTIVGMDAGLDDTSGASLSDWGQRVLQGRDLPEVEAPAAAGETVAFAPVEIRGDAVLLLPCEAGREVKVVLQHRKLGSFESGLAWSVHAADGMPVVSGRADVDASAEVQFTPDGDGVYRLVGSAGRSAWLVESANVPVGIATDKPLAIIHGPNRLAVRVPEGVGNFDVTLVTNEREPARLTVLDPAGREAATGQTLGAKESVVTLEVPVGEQGWGMWTLVTSPADEGRFEDHGLSLGAGFPAVVWLVAAD